MREDFSDLDLKIPDEAEKCMTWYCSLHVLVKLVTFLVKRPIHRDELFLLEKVVFFFCKKNLLVQQSCNDKCVSLYTNCQLFSKICGFSG